MYAVFEDGSRQYGVSEGDILRVDHRDVERGKTVEFNRVLLCKNEADVQIGQPVITGAKVVVEVIDHVSEKYTIQHFRRRKNYRRSKGHRQPFVKVRVTDILLSGQKPAKKE
jgi:large subunit ribosomal protein L21